MRYNDMFPLFFVFPPVAYECYILINYISKTLLYVIDIHVSTCSNAWSIFNATGFSEVNNNVCTFRGWLQETKQAFTVWMAKTHVKKHV